MGDGIDLRQLGELRKSIREDVGVAALMVEPNGAVAQNGQ